MRGHLPTADAAEAEHAGRGQAAHAARHPGQRVHGQVRELPVAAYRRTRKLAQATRRRARRTLAPAGVAAARHISARFILSVSRLDWDAAP